MLTAILLLFTIASSSGGHLAVSRAMKNVGEVHSLRVRALAGMVRAALRQPVFWLGMALNTLSFFTLLSLLSVKDLSFVLPATAGNYVLGTLGARYLLHERVSALRWAGVLLVIGGVALTVMG
jgi:drug/metabolite transporter (DMT)-like permease